MNKTVESIKKVGLDSVPSSRSLSLKKDLLAFAIAMGVASQLNGEGHVYAAEEQVANNGLVETIPDHSGTILNENGEVVFVAEETQDVNLMQEEVVEYSETGSAEMDFDLSPSDVLIEKRHQLLSLYSSESYLAYDSQIAAVYENLDDNIGIRPGYHLTVGNTTYDATDRDVKVLYYVVSKESNGTYEDALGVISVILNRMEDGRFHDDSLLSVVSQKNQFEVWNEAKVMRFIEKTDIEINENVWNALYDALFLGIRNNDYVEFKAQDSSDYSVTGEKKCQFVEDGNKYHNLALHLDRLNRTKEEILTLVL